MGVPEADSAVSSNAPAGSCVEAGVAGAVEIAIWAARSAAVTGAPGPHWGEGGGEGGSHREGAGAGPGALEALNQTQPPGGGGGGGGEGGTAPDPARTTSEVEVTVRAGISVALTPISITSVPAAASRKLGQRGRVS